MNILFLCTGNTCRSPMAEALFRSLAEQRGVKADCSSAGLATTAGQPASAHAIEACREIGLDLSGHRSRSLSAADLAGTDLFAVMTPGHARALASVGIPEEKILILGSGISDPYGGTLDDYRVCRDQLRTAVDALLAFLQKEGRL